MVNAGNTSNGTFTISVVDTTAPALTLPSDISGGLLAPVNPGALNTVKGGSTAPLKWQVRTPSGGCITSTSIVSSFALTQVSCGSLSTAIDEVDFTTTGGTTLRYDGNQFIQNWQTEGAGHVLPSRHHVHRWLAKALGDVPAEVARLPL